MRISPAVALLPLALLLPQPAGGEEAAPTAPPEAGTGAPQPPPPAKPDLEVRPALDLDFTLLEEPLGERPVDRALEGAVARRRTLLQAHQAAGLATWALMGTTVVYGRLNYADTYFGDGTGRYSATHKKLGYATASAFAFTGLLAALAPEPYPKKLRFDTATVHKGSMALATAGIVTQIVLGVGMRKGLGDLDRRQLANAHQAVGFSTFAAMSVGAITLVF